MQKIFNLWMPQFLGEKMELEQIICISKAISKGNALGRAHLHYNNLECLSRVAFSDGADIKPTKKGFIVPYGNMGIDGIRDIHDTYKTDINGNVSGGHTTIEHGIRISHNNSGDKK